jgi:zinc protease
MSRFARTTSLLAVAAPLLVAVAAAAQPLVTHPRELTYGPLAFEVPRADQHRHVLPSGVTVYVVEDHDLPLVDVTVHARLGSYLEPADKTGLAGLTGSLMRLGGAGEWTAEQLDERADLLAADLGSSIGETSGSAGVNCLSNVVPECLDLLFAMLQRPRFQQDRLDVTIGNMLEEMEQRNDDAGDILAREWQWALYGQDHFSTRLPTAASLQAIGRDDLVAFHRRWWQPQNVVVAVAGDIETATVLAQLEQRFAAWPSSIAEPGDAPAERAPWPPPAPTFTPVPGLYHVEKDIPQGKVAIGHLSRQWDAQWSDPAAYAAMVMNDILGGGGFTSRITQRIRSDEGLAYSAGSGFAIGTFWPGTFRIGFESKNETVAYASKIALEEVRRLQQEPPTDQELRISKASFVETFPRRFESADAVANLFASDDLLGRPHDYWLQYRDRISAVSAADVAAAARAELHPDRLVAVMVGPWEALAAGDPQGRAKLDALGLGEVTHLPLRDPLTLEPVPQP